MKPTERFLDFGFMDQTRFDAVRSSLINSFGAKGNYSFCGYTQSYMTGKLLTSSSSSDLGHS